MTAPRVDGRRPRLPTPADLSKEAQRIWTAIVASVPPEHFRPADAGLLHSYCEVTASAKLAARELEAAGHVVDGKASPWLNIQERAIRAQALLAAKLRLCPSARTDPKTIGRQAPSGKATECDPWDFK
jgi:phage terminase small subunit